MNTKRTMAVVCAGAVLLATGLVQAQGVGNLGALPSSILMDPNGTGWFIGTYGVIRDPNGPKWLKNLENHNGGPFVAPPGQTFTVQESLYIEGNLPWMDWHEEILTPGWEWAPPSVLFANGVPAPGLSISYIPGNTTQGGSIHFDFSSLAPGTKVDIRKQLQYVGGADGTAFFGTVQIAEYPTPEPASVGLLALGSLLALRRRRRTVR